MKKLSQIILTILVIVLVTSCIKKPDDPEPVESKDIPEISNLSRNIEIPKPGDQIVVSATVTAPSDVPITAVKLKWTLNGANPMEVTMNKNNNSDVYSGAIPAQNDGMVVAYTVAATNKNGTAQKNGTYTVTAVPPEITDDCTHLSLNEINGNGDDKDRYIELYNSSSNSAIRLEKVTISYNNLSSEPAVTWKGTADQILLPGKFLLLKGTKGTGDLSTGLSATQGIVVELTDNKGNRIDLFKIGEDPDRNSSYSRIPDGTGKWYLTYFAGTPGVTNGTNDFGATLIPTTPIISDFSRSIQMPSSNDAVKVSATVKAFGGTTLSSVILKWTVSGTAQTDITMTEIGDVYSATIPAQITASVIEYKVVATNNENEKEELSSNYVVTPVGGFDYSKLRLNEVNGVGDESEKFFELINMGSETISLADCQIEYNANGSANGVFPPNGNQGITWKGNATQFIEAGKLFCLIGRGNPGSFTTGLTAQRILIITLKDPSGKVIDRCIRAEDTGDYAIRDKSFSRIPDGTGPFYFTTPTPCAENGASSAGLLLVPETRSDTPPDYVYTHLALNEISGNHKFVEIYNSSTEDIPLHGVKLQRNDGTSAGGSEWVGSASDVIPAGAYRIFLFNSFMPANLETNPAFAGWKVSSGISSQQILKVALIAPSGKPIGVFIRGDVPLPAWQTTSGVTQNSTDTYSRMNDGTWAYADPTPGAANGTKKAEITNPGYLTAQP